MDTQRDLDLGFNHFYSLGHSTHRKSQEVITKRIFCDTKPRGSAGFILSCHNAGIQTNSLSSVDSKHTVNHFTLTQGIFLETFQVGS